MYSMGWLSKKKGEDVIDLSQMQKREHIPRQESSVAKPTLDLSSQRGSPSDFLSSLARVGNAQPSTPPREASSGSVQYGGAIAAQLRAARAGGFVEVNELKLKLDDANYKIERLERKVRELEERLRMS